MIAYKSYKSYNKGSIDFYYTEPTEHRQYRFPALHQKLGSRPFSFLVVYVAKATCRKSDALSHKQVRRPSNPVECFRCFYALRQIQSETVVGKVVGTSRGRNWQQLNFDVAVE